MIFLAEANPEGSDAQLGDFLCGMKMGHVVVSLR